MHICDETVCFSKLLGPFFQKKPKVKIEVQPHKHYIEFFYPLKFFHYLSCHLFLLNNKFYDCQVSNGLHEQIGVQEELLTVYKAGFVSSDYVGMCQLNPAKQICS